MLTQDNAKCINSAENIDKKSTCDFSVGYLSMIGSENIGQKRKLMFKRKDEILKEIEL